MIKSEISFSIITVTLNAKKELLKTINSIQKQDYNSYTHIIKDGFSKDKTYKLDFSKFRNTEFYQFKDQGVYDAMNQGFELAQNEYVIFLNAGDIFFSKNSLKELSENIKNNPNFNVYSGGTIQINLRKKRITRIIGISNLYKYLPLAQLPHPSFVVKKSILSKLQNTFDSNLRIASDYKQQLILRKKRLWKTCYLNQIISIMPLGGISTLNNYSIFNGFKETCFISYKIYKLLIPYILFIKIILNFYSKFQAFKFNDVIINYDEFI
tara:strand:- start:427 stop:1227 length:801 start_codon:yes stop_codon:yes gene_type:complete